MSQVRALRAVVVLTMLFAWFAAANHCTFAAATAAAAQPTLSAAGDEMPPDCPMQAKQRSSGKRHQNGCGDLPCCKNLPATAAAGAKLLIGSAASAAPHACSAVAVIETRSPLGEKTAAAGTGPPGESSFAELVLQRSLLAHAPPPSLR